MGFWIKVVKKEPRAKRVSTAYPFYPFTRFMHRLPFLLRIDKGVDFGPVSHAAHRPKEGGAIYKKGR